MSQFKKLKSGIKNGTQVTLKLSSNVGRNSNNETNFPHKLLLNNTQVLRIRKAFANNSSANIKSSKTQLSKIGQSGEFLGRLLGPSLKTGLSLMKHVRKPSAKCILIPLELTAAASALNVAIPKKVFGSGKVTLIISNEEMDDIMQMISITKKIKMKNFMVLFVIRLVLSIICTKRQNEDDKIFKEEEESIEVLKILDLSKNI